MSDEYLRNKAIGAAQGVIESVRDVCERAGVSLVALEDAQSEIAKSLEAAFYDSRVDTFMHIARVQDFLTACVFDLLERIGSHDASKLIDPELSTFDKFTPLLKVLKYGTPAYKQSLKDMGEGLQHHYDTNPHHPEHHENGVNDMTLFDVMEMVCDWCGAVMGNVGAERYREEIRRSLEVNKERFSISDQLAAILLNTVDYLDERMLTNDQ